MNSDFFSRQEHQSKVQALQEQFESTAKQIEQEKIQQVRASHRHQVKHLH